MKSKGNAVWRNKPVCKVGINDNKNTALFLEKKTTTRFVTCCVGGKKKVRKLHLFLRNISMVQSYLCLLCMYVEVSLTSLQFCSQVPTLCLPY